MPPSGPSQRQPSGMRGGGNSGRRPSRSKYKDLKLKFIIILVVLQLCANSYKNCAINDTSMKFYELLEDIISKYFNYRDTPDFSYFVCNQKIALLDVTAQYTILPAIACS